MTSAVAFLNSFAQAMSALSLYPEGHRSRDRALENVYEKLQGLLAENERPQFSFLGDDVIYGAMPLRELRGWEWSDRLSDLGIQRLQFDRSATLEELEGFLDELLARLTLQAIDTAEARPTRPSGIRFGMLGIRGQGDELEETAPVPTATLGLSLGDEAETIRWLHDEISGGQGLPLAEAEAVVRALSVAMHGDQEMMVPLLQLRNFDEYTTTHSLNVSVLAMALAEWVGLGSQDVRAFGVAGLLHDLGKTRVPIEVLNKAGKLNEGERALMRKHPVDGARIILDAEPDLDLAAVVAYEHHIMLNGGGYPTFTYDRDCHRASKLVHVCDVYDALRTDRPYRDAWPAPKVLAYIEERSGVEFDGALAHAFTQMMQEWEPQAASLTGSEGSAED